MARKNLVVAYRDATARANAGIARLGVLADEPARRARLTGRVELFLWKFLKLRWHDIHRFVEAVENKEAMEFVEGPFQPGRVFHFFSERQTAKEWEDTLTVGLSLVFASMKRAGQRGFNPKTAGIFTLQRMLEQELDEVDDLEDLLQRGAPT